MDLFQHEEFYWGLLAGAGYVNAIKTDGDTYMYTLKTPNKEMNEYLKYHFQTQLEKEKEKYDELDSFRCDCTVETCFYGRKSRDGELCDSISALL